MTRLKNWFMRMVYWTLESEAGSRGNYQVANFYAKKRAELK